MKIASAWSTDPNSELAAIHAYEMLSEKLQGVPQLVLVHSSCNHDNEIVVRRLRSLAPNVPLQGGTSCLGVMTQTGFHTKDGKGLGILGVLDPEGSYGVGITDVSKAS